MQLLLRIARTLFNGIVLLTCVMVGTTVWLEQRDYDFHMRLIPRGLQVVSMTYHKEDAGGFGPAANESGVIVYTLPREVAADVDRHPMTFFASLGPRWRDWKPTPIPIDRAWSAGPESASYAPSVSPVTAYLDKYAGGVEIAPEVRDAIDDAILHSGSYYAFTPGGGLIIVTPGQNAVYFIYRG
jgi:hypothetical protein